VVVEWKGAQRGGRLTAVNSMAGESSTATWSNGHRRRPSGCRGTGCLGEACEVAGSAGGRREASIDSGRLTEEGAVKDGALPSNVVNGSRCNQVPEATGDAAEFLAGSSGNG
jgi:hypothetical protein